MLNLKKLYSDELLQLALILSLLRVDPDSYLGLDIQTIGVGSLDLHNGSGWHTDSHTIIHRPAFVHPKNLDTVLLNYERDLFEDLNALGRYNRINTAHNDIHAYLLNIDDKPGPSAAVNNATHSARNTTSPNPPQPSQTSDENLGPSELTQEDMDLIEVLWKQDVDLGFTPVVDPAKNAETTFKEESEDDLEKLKALEAINHADEKESKIKEEPLKEEDPWAGIAYTVDLETGEYILSSATTSSPSSSDNPDSAAQASSSSCSQDDRDHDQPLLSQANLNLVGLGDEDSLGLHESLGLEDDFASDLLNDDCLLDGCADGFLSNDSLGLPDGFNLEEALQLVGLDEVELEKKPEVKEKKSEVDSDAARSDSRASNSENDEQNQQDPLKLSDDDDEMNVIHPQYHHTHARSFGQRSMPLVRTMGMEHHQRWPDMFMGGSSSEPFAHPGAVANSLHQSHLNYSMHHPHHHHHHHHHSAYGDVTAPQPRQVLMSNATIPPPVGDLNSTGTYHNTGNLGSAVATSMNLTNHGETLSVDSVAAFKPEPTDMMASYYQNASSDTMNQTDMTFPFLEEPTPWLDDTFNAFNNVSDGMAYGGGSTSTGGGVASASANGGASTTSMLGASASGNTATDVDGRMETSSDSAVSSMGSERVASLSDGGEWMETGSNSSHTQADSHYSMDYNGKYRMPYDCGYSLAAGSTRSQRNNCAQSAAERAGLAPVAQKKHHMFGKRCFQDQQGPMTPAAGQASALPSKYDYDAAQNVAAAGPPGQAYSGPIEGAAGPQPEIKYSCSLDFNRQAPARSTLEHVHHNHTYNLPPESSGAMQRPLSRDKKGRKSGGDSDEHMSRDEKRARALNVPITVSDIINLPMDEFNERLSKYDLNDNQLGLIRDIRRRGKNKVAAQNCRKRKLDQINSLSDEVREMRTRKMRLKSDREYMLGEVARVKEKFGQLYRHILHSLRDPAGRPYNPQDYSLQLSAEGNVVLVPKSNQSTHYGFPMKKPDHQHQQHHHQHKE